MIEKFRIEDTSVIGWRLDALLLSAHQFERPRWSLKYLKVSSRPSLSAFAGRHPIVVAARAGEISDRRERRVKFVHVGFDSGADIQRESGSRRVECGDICAGDVVYENVIAGL